MLTVQQVLNQKQTNEIWHIRPDNTVYEAIQVMATKKVGALLVMKGVALKGIISERDYAREVILKGHSSTDTRVDDIMSSNVISVSSSESVEASLAVMTDNHIRHLPIVDENMVIGVLSLGDLVKTIINDQQSTIQQLESYIRG
ncbi:MAG: CBS domain-containing protein [Pseudomonadota bacterium]|jgi:CBS domain-containing protein|nr:CBS domain-containing protein [Pseudomonadales bacterium]MEC9222926.1 CBS domain-containing protein [Pseudomonadota bacterium]MEE2608021.1 CBS domain-containing protein [Pseudomonadota bacterium]|tara:strand:+ start:404 stop:835 length:432 start_codon:yes stop_codon:yes gene_type:complete